AVALAYLVGALVFRALLDPETLARWIEPRAEAALNRDVELEGVGLTFFPGLGAEVTGLQVNNLPDFEGPPLARVERLRMHVALLPLLRRRVQVDEVRVERPVLHLITAGDGRTNYGDLVPAGEEEPEETEVPSGPPVELAVRSFDLTGGRVEYDSAPDSTGLVVDGISARASLERRGDGTWSLTAATDAPEVRVRHPVLGAREVPFRSVALETDATAGPGFEWLQVQRGTLRLEEAALGLSGRLESLDQPVRRVDLRVTAEALAVERLVTFLPDSLRERLPGAASGRVAVSASIRGEAGPDLRPRLDGTVRIEGAGLLGSDGTSLAEAVDGTVELTNDGVTVRELGGRVLGGPFSLTASLGAESPYPFRASVEAAPDLARATALAALPEGVELRGIADARLSMAGRATAPSETRIDGTVILRELEAADPRLGVPVRVAEGRFTFTGRDLAWEGLELELGPDRVATSGTLEDYLAVLETDGERPPRLTAEARSRHLDLDRVLPPEGDTTVTWGQLAFARLGGRALNGRSAEEAARDAGYQRPSPLPIVGELRLSADTLRSAPWTLTRAGARVAFSPRLIQVSEITAELFGGRIGGELSLGLGDEPIEPFSVSLRVDAVEAADFLATTSPLGRKIAGRLGLELSFGGGLDTLLLPDPTSIAGNGRARATEGRILETPLTARLASSLAQPALASPGFREWSGPFRLEGPTLRFDEALLALESGELRYGGLMGLDGSLDLGVRFALPAARVDSAALARSGLFRAVAGRIGGQTSLVQLGLRIRGTLTDPRIEPEASLAVGDLRRALDAEARERAEQLRAQAERRLQEQRDTARARVQTLQDTAAGRVQAARDTAAERADALRDTAAARVEAQRRQLEERAEEQREEARQELRERGRGLLRRLTGGADTARSDTVPPDTTR
ncbi:MAG TPA: AsmA-like C-terminal region-containing protein, partial [Longimicrobiales bacterium]|nr:AsmA-like C-terminal region-containing protein [Longimicrobiales bacterium]